MTLRQYLKTIEREVMAGDATEHTHRPALKELIEGLAPNVRVVNEPARIACGAPDLAVVRLPEGLNVGYIETKDVGASLDEAVKSPQIQRYLQALPNLIVTNYLEFRWYAEGKYRTTIWLGVREDDGKIAVDEAAKERLPALIQDFVQHEPTPVRSPDELAERMARLTHLIRDAIAETLKGGRASQCLIDLRAAVATALVPDIEEQDRIGDFADMYAQTLAYGLFAARCNHRGDPKAFRRSDAAAEIPKTNPFLRRLFATITGPDLEGEPYVSFVEDLVRVLANADMAAVLEQFGRRKPREDPVVHFYETFLAAYDPNLRETRGVYYTPEPVVSYIVNSIDAVLREKFGVLEGLADTSTVAYWRREGEERVEAKCPRVLILDPACGTGSFLYAIVDLIRSQFARSGNAGMWPGYVRERLLSRLFGFELLMAPYAVAHLKLGMQLAALDMTEGQRRLWACDFAGAERLGIYLTNTLEDAEGTIRELYGPYRIIADEAKAAAGIKRDLPIMVVLGNPPYSGHSANASWRNDANGRKEPTFIGRLIKDYYVVDGRPLGEKNPKWLQDDYVKFIRWAQWRIERTGAGVLGFITNHGYLDNPTFRGMRQSLMRTFDEIYILDLHGNAKKKEVCPDGSKDENVFAIQQGVAIGIFIRLPGEGPRSATVHHADLWGLQEQKYKRLFESNINSTRWRKLNPKKPDYLFSTIDAKLRVEYERGWHITSIMPVSSVGIVTARDNLTIHFSKDECWDTVRRFASLREEQARREFCLGDDAQDWQVALAQEDVKASGPARQNIQPVLYRPYDRRFTYYTGKSKGFLCRPRPETMQHMLAGVNRALAVGRAGHVIGSPVWDVVFCSRHMTEFNLFRRGGNCLFPLYLYANNKLPATLFDYHDDRRPNLSGEFVEQVCLLLGLHFIPDGCGDLKNTLGPEDILHYVYAVFHSPGYRERYAEFLKRDFPRVPLTADRKLFKRLCALGGELVKLHLLESEALSKPTTRFPVPGDNSVSKGFPKYLPPGGGKGDGPPPKRGQSPFPPETASGRVHINKDQYFECIAPEVWAFQVGGYQVCEKWLKDRVGRRLSLDDLEHYQKVVAAIAETIRLMSEIDKVILASGGWPDAFSAQ